MADKRFQLTFDVNANLSNLNNALTKMKADFKNLNLSDSINKDLNKTFTQLEQEINKFTALANKKTFNIQEINEANKSFQRITNLFNTLQVQTNKIKGIKLENLVPTESVNKVKQLNKALEDLENISLGKVSQEIEKLNKALKNARDERDVSKVVYEGKQGEQTASETTRDNLKKQLEEERTKVNELTKAYNTLNEAVENRDENAIKDAKHNLEKEQQALDKLQNSYNKAATAADKAAEATAKAKTNYEKQQASVLALTNQLEELKNGQGNLESIRQELHELGGIDLGDLPTDLDGLINTIEELKTKELSVPNNGLKNIDNNADEAAAAVHELNVETEKQVETGRGYNEQAKDLENLANQVKQFFSIGNTVQLFKRAIRSAFDTIKELDAVMTQTAVVTDFTVGDMWAQLPEYTKRANELGVSVKGAYEAATLYYQQGLDTNQVMGVSNETLKMAKIAAIDYATATDYMTSALRGFNMEVNENSAKRVNDIYSQLAAKTAADTEEISIAMSKTAPLAHNAGMEIETTAALLSQMIETTREAPETLGTAMKTVIARFQELKKDPALIEPVEGEIVDANKIEAALRTIGVALRDTSGQFRDLDDVFLEISQKWNSLDTNTQRYIATIAAGSRQQSRFIAMMANYDRTMELVEYANNSAGASQKQFEKTLDSMQSKLDRLKNAWNEFTMGLANNSVIKTVVDLLTDLLNTINKISSGISGNNGILKSLVDIGILMGGLKLGKAAFTGFFGWLQGTGGKAGKKVGDNLSKGLLGSLTNFGKSGFLQKIKSISDTLDGLDFGALTKKEAFNQIFPIITKLGVSFKNLKTTATETGNGIINIFKKIPPQAYAIAGGIAAATVVLALFIKGIKDSSIEGRIKAAEESTKRAEEAANQAKEAYDNLLEGKSKYSELQNTLDNLAYGTTAWKEALIEANGQVLELLQTFPQLAQYLQSGTDGRLQIAEGGWDEVLKQQQETIRRTTNDLIGSQIYRANLESEKIYKDLIKSTGINRKNALNELIQQYEQNPRFFAKDENGNYSEQLQQFATRYGINPQKIYEAQNALRDYEAAIQSNGATIEGYVNSLVANNAKLDELSTDISDLIREAYSKSVGENYNSRYEAELSKLRGSKDVASNLDSILEEYKLEVSGTTKKKLQELYKYLANITGEEIDEGILDNKAAMQEAIVRMRLGDEIEASINKVAQRLKHDTTGGIQKILNILGREIGDFTTEDLDIFKQAFGENGSKEEAAKALKMSTKELEDAIIDMGYTVEDVNGNLIADFDRFRQDFFDGTVELGETIQQARVNIATKLLETGYSETDVRSLVSPGRSGRQLTEVQTLGLSSFMDKTSFLDSDIRQNLWNDVLENLKMGSLKTAEETLNLINNIDFSNTIDSLLALEEAAENGTDETKKLAQSMLEASSEQLNIGKAFQNFTISDEYTQMEESLKDFIKTNGKISSRNIKDLAKENNTLNKLLKLEAVNANGLAKALTGVASGKVGFEQIDSAILKALSSTTDLTDELSELNDKFSNFDKGFDTNVNVENYQKAFEDLQTYIDNGELGNEQFKNLYDFLFGEGAWKEAVENDFNGLQDAVNAKKALFENDGLAFWGSFIQKIESENIEIPGLEFDTEGNIATLELTSQQLKQVLIDNMSLTEDEATAMLGVLKTYNPAASLKLEQNDEIENYKVWLDEISQGQEKVISTQKLQLWADLTGKTIEEIRNEINSLNGSVKVVDWLNEEGLELKGQELIDKIKKSLHNNDESWDISQDLGVTTETLFTRRGDEQVEVISYEVAIQYAEDNDLTLEQVQSIADEKGWQVTGELGIFPDLAGYQKAIDEQNAKEAEDLSKKSQEAVDSIDTSTFEGNIESATKNGMVSGGNTGIGILASAIAGTAFTGTVRLDAIVDGQYLNGTRVSTRGVDSGKSFSNTYHPTGSGGRFTREASGTDYGGLKHSEIALTGEEGYELAYDSRGAFLLGSKGPEVAKLEKGTVIYPHELSKKILKGYSKNIFPNHKTGTIPNYLDAPYKWTVSPLNGASVSYAQAASDFESLTNSMKEAAETAEDITEETEKWENTVDWLYNMTQKVNQELRVRNKLEKQYNRALKTNTGTGEDLRRLTNQEIVSLKKRQDMQKEMIELRKKELHTYMMLNKEMMKYAIIDNWDDMTIHIAWDSINNITDKDEYDKAVDFLNRLEDVQKEIYNLEDDIEDIEDELIELKERGKEQYRNLEDRVLDALISEQQEMIDEQEKTIKAINDAESSLIDAIQKNIDKMRQDRENEETESSIAEKERRLAYLRQDTTGSNALEIKKLEDELAKEKQDYSDALIDQALKDLKDQNDIAKEQRDKQIEIAQSQLDWQEKTGYWADEATRIVREGIGNKGIMDENSRLYQLLYNQEGVETMSNASRDWWKDELEATIKEAYIYLANVLEPQNNGADVVESMKQNSQSWMTASSSEQSNLHAENERLAKEYEAATGEKLTYNSSEGAWYKENGQRLYTISKDEIAHDVVAKMRQNSNAWGSASESKQKQLAAENVELARRLENVLGQDIKKENGVWYIGTRKLYDVYKRGGLADFTGPAWLDGTKSKPEMVLNAKDTQNFIQLKDILAGLRSGIVGNNQEQSGDWYFDIDINVGEIANDYDVDKVADRVKQAIYKETTYRNVNAINFLK